MTESPASLDALTAALKKSLPLGYLHRIPKHPARREIVMGVLSLWLERRYPYAEVELNEVLSEALQAFHATVDHVTCRRYMVDLGFVKRDRAGKRYFLNFPKLETTLSASAREQAPQLVADLATGRARSCVAPAKK